MSDATNARTDKPLKNGLKKSFTSDVIILVSGTTLAQFITMVSAPLVTRLYGADAFGTAALFSSIVSIIAVVSCFRYELSIMLPKTDEEAANLLAVSLIVVASLSLSLIPIFWFANDYLAELFNAPGISPYMWLVPLAVFLTGAFSAFNYWNSRKKEFGRLSKSQVAKAATTSGTQLGIGFSGFVSGGTLIVAGVFGQAVATSALGYQAWKFENSILWKSISWKRINMALRSYGDFPKYDILSALLNAMTLQLPVFILSIFFTSTIVGYYSLGLVVLQMPMTFIGTAIGQVFFQRAAEAYHEDKKKLTSMVEETTKKLILLGFPIILLLAIIGKELFILMFGSHWSEAGVYAEILSFWIMIAFVTSPLSTLFCVLGRLRLILHLNVILLIIRACALIVGGYQNDVYLSLFLYSLSGGIIYLLIGRFLLMEAGVCSLNLLRSISKQLALGLMLLSVVLVTKIVLIQNPIFIILVGIICVAPYYIINIISDREIFSLLSTLFRRVD